MSKIDKESLVKEIERLKGQLIWGACAAQIEMETNCKDEAYNEVLSFINSLPDEPASEDLEKEMDSFFEQMPVLEHENIFEDTFQNIARHFAEWQKDKDTRDMVKSDDSHFKKCYELGKKDMKEQMMKIITKDDNLEEAGIQYVKTHSRDIDWTPDVIKLCLEEAFISGGEYVFKKIKYE